MKDPKARDDLASVQSAVLRLRSMEARRWVLQAGPLPAEPATREAYFDVARRGVKELENFLRSEGLSLD
jgi:hypothetical protein